MNCQIKTFITAILLLIAFPASYAEVLGGYRAYGPHVETNNDSIFQTPEEFAVFPRNSLRQEGWLSYQQSGLNLLVTGRYTVREDDDPKDKVILNELYYDFLADAFDFTVGKKILGWGVGQAFRPLDVIQREDRRRLISTDLEGLPQVSAEYFTDSSSHTAIYARRTEQDQIDFDGERDELAYKYYRLIGDWDTLAVAHWSEDEGFAGGAGAALVISNEMELHGSFLHREQCIRSLNSLTINGGLLSTSDPFIDVDVGNCSKVLIGGSWTGESGIGLLFEAWHDGEAHSEKEWDQQRELGKKQHALLTVPAFPSDVVYQNLKADQQFFDQPVLLENNLFMMLSYDGERLDPSIDMLFTPDDQGVAITARLNYELNSHVILLGAVRYFAGATDSAYSEIADQSFAFAGLDVAF